MSYKDFDKDFNNDMIVGTLFFYGSEDYLMEWAIKSLVEKYVSEEFREVDDEIIKAVELKKVE